MVSYLHADHLGSASLTTNASGAKYGELRYRPYGETRYVWGTTPTDRRFTGQLSEESGLGSLYDYGARFYSPVLGRFLSADTIVPSPGNPQSLNRYSYVLGNPLKYIDSNGYFAVPALVIAIGIAVTAGVIARAAYYAQNEAPPMFGYGPDYRGLKVAQSTRSIIEQHAQTEGTPAIMVAAGMAVQSQWCCGLQDWAEVNIQRDSNPSQGIAQMTPGEMQGYVGGSNVYDSNLSILALTRKIQASVEACLGCSTTDKFIVAGMAQNGFGPEAVREVLGRYRTNDGIKWGNFFAGQKAPSGGVKDNWLAYRSGGRSWNLFQLQLFLNDLIALKEQGWELPSDVNLPYMQCLVSGAGNCDP